jgi:YidC/Oxa1 family membrane protein insertase
MGEDPPQIPRQVGKDPRSYQVLSFLNPLFDAVAWVIVHIHAVLAVPFGADSGWAWGLSIVLLVILLRVLMLPLFIKQVRTQQRMQQHMPQLQEIRRKYKNDKQKLNEETMKYYKENGVNPLSGCLPLLAQFPVFIALFNVLRAIAENHLQYGLTQPVLNSAKHAHVFGVLLSDKFLFMHPPASLSVRAVILVSVLISACTTFLTMRQSQRRGMMQQGPVDPDNPMAQSQKYMIYIAPLFALSGLYWQYGLVIYWVTNNLWTMGQQHFLFRNLPVVDSATVGAATAPAASVKSAAVSTGKTSGSKTAQAGKTAQSAGKANPAGKAAGSSAPQSAKAPAGRTSSPSRGPGQSPAKAAPAAKQAQPAKAAAGAGVNGSAAAAAAPVADQGGGLSSRLRLGSKSKAEPEPEVAPTKIVRNQPVRNTRSKRSGNKR